MKDGSVVQVDLGFSSVPKRDMHAYILQQAKKDKVYLKGLGFWDIISTHN
jgi:hypothetical protein